MTKRFRQKRIGRLCAWSLSFVLTLLCAVGTVGAAEPKSAFPNGSLPVRLVLDGEEVLSGECALIHSVTYVPLRSFSELVGADSVSWNPKTATATIQKGSVAVQVTDGARYITASERCFYTVSPILNIGDRLFVPVRPLAKALGLEVTWDNESRSAVLTFSEEELVTGSRYYRADDLYWLSRIISAESAGESLEGQIAVGNVVLNRVRHRQYPNTVYGVIFDRVGGVQFSPASMGTVYRTPSALSVVAAKICLEGSSLSENILFFMNPRIATSNWISRNRPFAFRIGNHDFYF